MGRTARLTCQHGVRPAPADGGAGAATAGRDRGERGTLDAAAAARPVEDTAGSGGRAGQQIEAQTASGQDGCLIADAEGITYVAAIGDSTLVVTLARQVVPASGARGFARARRGSDGCPEHDAHPRRPPSHDTGRCVRRGRTARMLRADRDGVLTRCTDRSHGRLRRLIGGQSMSTLGPAWPTRPVRRGRRAVPHGLGSDAWRRAGFVPTAEVVRDGDDALVSLELPGLDAERDIVRRGRRWPAGRQRRAP